MNQSTYPKFIMMLALLLMINAVLVACGRRPLPEQGAAPGDGGPTATPATAATPLAAQFKQPTTIIEEAAKEEKEEKEEAEEAPTPEVDLSRGERTYTNKGCGECHGLQGEGVESKGSPLAGIELTETEFTDILRTGGKGELGNEHLYGTQAISPSGMEALYAYVKSFSGQ